jgi:hypothetical protein
LFTKPIDTNCNLQIFDQQSKIIAEIEPHLGCTGHYRVPVHFLENAEHCRKEQQIPQCEKNKNDQNK